MRDRASRLFLPAVLAIIVLGALQSLLRVAFPGVSFVTYLDDLAAIFAMLVLLIGRAHKIPVAVWVMTGLWGALVAIAALRSLVGFSVTLELSRQLLLPAALILMGMALNWQEWRRVAQAGLIVGALNGVYAVLEMMFGRIIDPAVMAHANEPTRKGVPASYFYWDSEGVEHVRAGGLALNPPVAGILIGGAIVLGFFLAMKWWQYVLVFSLAAPLYFTNSRAGILIAIAGVIVPVALRHIGLLLGAVLTLVGAIAGFFYFGAQGNSLLHLKGLTIPISNLATSPFGEGLGMYGNFAKRNQVDVVGSESLIGVAIGATGVVGLLLICILIFLLTRRLVKGSVSPTLTGLALGVLGAALVSESVSALNATVPLWAAVGVVLLTGDSSNRLPLWPRLRPEGLSSNQTNTERHVLPSF